jgi:hypothetical protein
MRTLIVVAVLLTWSTTAAAQLLAGVRVTPETITIVRGETAFLEAHGIVGCCSKFPWSVEFRSSDPSIADAGGLLLSPSTQTAIAVTGHRPGTIMVVSPSVGFGSVALALVHVNCGEEPPIHAVTARQSTALAAPVRLTLSVDVVTDRDYLWFQGRTGDQSRPLAGHGPAVDFAPDSYGVTTVWVRASTPCSTSTAEFQVDVSAPRSRLVRR